MTNPTTSNHLVSPGVRAVLKAAAVVVIIPAAVISYVHMHELASEAGEGWLAWLEPLPTDGLVVFASTLLYAQHRAGQKVHWLVVPAIILGVLASLGANVLSREPDLVDPMWLGFVVRAWPPLALAITADLVWQLVGLRSPDASQDAPSASVEIGQQVNIGTMNVGSQDVPHGPPVAPPGNVPATQPEALLEPSRSLPTGRPVIDTSSRPGPSRSRVRKASGKALSDNDWIPFAKHVREALAAEGKPFTPNALKERAKRDGTSPGSLGHDRATRLVTHLQEATS
jgi:hypothetical protein